MIRVSLLFLACLSIVVANSNDDIIVPTCVRELQNDILVDLSNLGLTTLRKGFVTGNSVTCVNLAGNAISELKEGAFDRLPRLRHLDLARNPISFEDFMKMKLPALKTLVLDGPFRSEETDSDRHNPTSNYYTGMFHVIDYYEGEPKNRLDLVSPIHLPRLEELSFRNYESAAVSQWLNYLDAPKLSHLNVGSNHFAEILLSQRLTENIIYLYADDNQLHMMALSLPKLRHLMMDGNRIHNLCMHYCDWRSLSVGGMPALEHLSLANNKISNVEANAFENNIHLKYLNLGGNEITSLPRNLFHNVPLQTLALRRNALTSVPVISGLRKLELLDLSDNFIDRIDSTTFRHLTHLRSVDLRENRLTTVPDGTFADLPALTELNFARNNLTTLAPNWIGPRGRLERLKLDGNSFSHLANMSLGTLERLDNLCIAHNPLGTVTVRDLALLPPNTKIKVW